MFYDYPTAAITLVGFFVMLLSLLALRVAT